MARKYANRRPGDVINNNAVLLERVDNRLWKIRCACGNVYVAQPSTSSGRCRDCGYREVAKNVTIHGESSVNGKRASRLYNIWLGMRQRCTNSNKPCYSLYGGRGIYVDHCWDNYLAFKEWAIESGYSDGLTLDRIDVNGGYSPSNCRWATQKEQMRNTRKNHLIDFNGEVKTLAEWAEEAGLPYHTLKRRINNYGFTIEEALTIPANKGNNQTLRKQKK